MTDLITLPRATVQQALEAWEQINKYGFVLADYEGPMEQAITALKAALVQPEQEPVALNDGRLWQYPDGSIGVGTPAEPPEALRLADALADHTGCTLAQMDQAAAELRRQHALNGELGAALRRLISYCNNLENRLMEADGEHPAMQEAKEAWAKVEGKA
jgi:hypothetical protein